MPYSKHVSTPKCSPLNLLNYIHRADRTMVKERDDAIPKAGCLLSSTPAEMAVEMYMLKRSFPEKTNYRRQYIHEEISYAKGEGEEAASKRGIGVNQLYYEHLQKVMSDPNLEGWQWDAALHLNRPHPHWHIAVNIMKTNGELIKTNYLHEKIREISDKYAKELGLNIINARQHTALRNESMAERNARDEERMLTVTRLRIEAAEVLKQTKAKTLVSLQEEMSDRGVELSRTGDEGGLVYKYRNRYFPASRLGKVFQLYGLKRTMAEGFEKAKADIELLPKKTKFRDLNLQIASKHPDYTLLSLGNERPMDERRELISILGNARLLSKSLEDFKEEVSAHGVVIKDTGKRCVYRYEEQSFGESSIPKMFSHESLIKHFEEKSKDIGAGGSTREYKPEDTHELENSRESTVEETERNRQDDRRR